ncbi:hypothetical protein Tco_1379538 [Tanacetum coccineum]
MEMHNAFNQQYGYHPHMSPSSNPISSQSSQRFSPLNSLDIEDDEFAPLFGEGSSQPVVQDSPDESPSKRLRPSNEITTYFHKETGSAKRSLESVNCKWKNQIRPKVSQFCEMYNSVQDRHESGACENTIYQKAEKEYRAYYNSAFQLVECWNVLKDHKKWKKVEYPMYLKAKYPGSKKSRTSESASDSAHNGLNLNDEAADLGDEEI